MSAEERDLRREALSESWLASRLGIEPRRIVAMRRDGELIGYQPAGSREVFYPSWQFDAEFRPLSMIPRLVREARERGIKDDDLYRLLTRKSGLTGSGRLADAL